MLLIMHCWHYVRRYWYMKILILIDPHSCFDSGDSFDDGNIHVVDPDVADGGDHIWCMIVVDDYHGLV